MCHRSKPWPVARGLQDKAAGQAGLGGDGGLLLGVAGGGPFRRHS